MNYVGRLEEGGWDERRGGRNATIGVAIAEGKRLNSGELPSSSIQRWGGGREGEETLAHSHSTAD